MRSGMEVTDPAMVSLGIVVSGGSIRLVSFCLSPNRCAMYHIHKHQTHRSRPRYKACIHPDSSAPPPPPGAAVTSSDPGRLGRDPVPRRPVTAVGGAAGRS